MTADIPLSAKEVIFALLRYQKKKVTLIFPDVQQQSDGYQFAIFGGRSYSIIFYKDNPTELIFPVDNLCWWNRKKISLFYRQRIMSYQRHIGITVPIPVRYYMFL